MRVVGLRLAVLASACGPGIDGGAQDGSSAGGSSGSEPMTDPFVTTESSASSTDASTSDDRPDVGVAGPCSPAVFLDPGLEQAVRESLDVGPEFVLTTESMQPLTHVGAIGLPLHDLSGIECATALEHMSFTQYADARPDPDGIEDLTPLLELPVLQGVTLEYQAVSELIPFPHLLRLELRGNPIMSIAGLVGSDALRGLDISDSNTTDLSPVMQLPALQWLEASDNPITDITVLLGSEALHSLYIRDTAVADLSVIPDLPALERLDVDRTAVTDLSALAGSSSLDWLSCTGTGVTDLAVVGDLPALQNLWINDTLVSDLGVLEGRALERLVAARILIDAVPVGLAAHTVFLNENGLTDPTPMATWDPPGLVDLSDNQIDDLTPLFSMPWTDLESCVTVDLRGNPLRSPDTAVVAQELCDALMIDLRTDVLDCSSPDCPPPPP